MHQLTPQQIKQFQKTILDWYAMHKRDLPWRQSRDPYRILISEIMLQQTQVSRVIPKYEAWLEVLPTIEHLDQAPIAEVLRLWSGLGYNRRALNLKKMAEIVVKQYGGNFPQNEKELLQLPGIGQYTARALLCFAFDQQVAVVDTNVRKVILTKLINRHSGEEERRLQNLSKAQRFNVSDSGQARMTDKEVQNIAEQLLPVGFAYDWNQALMDYAAHVLKKEKIPIPKQSKFIGSHRYYRGQVLKTLLQHKKLPIKTLGELIKKDYEEHWLQSLLIELKDEGFVVVEDNVISLNS